MNKQEEILKRALEIGEHYTLEVKRESRQGRLEIKFIPKDKWGEDQLPTFTETFSNQLCSLLYTYFGLGGKITDVG